MNKPSQQKQLAWAEHLKSQCESGLSLQAYCEQHLLKPSQFWYWKRKLQGSASDHSARGSRSNQSGFVVANVVEASVDQGLTITLPNGISLSGINEHNHELIKHLLGTLT